MIGEALDRLVSVFSPASAARRSHARTVFQSGVQRRYDAARKTRLNSQYRPANQSADLDLSQSADELRWIARDLVANNAYARGIIGALTRNVIGCGIKPQSRVEDEETARRIEGDFEKWSRNADVAGRLSFPQIQQLAYRETKEAGEVLVRFVNSSDRRRLTPLALELIEADRFANNHFVRGINPETGNEVRRGVELNAAGEPVTYWLYKRNPNSLNSWRQEAAPFRADEFVHLFRPERIGQTRGITVFAAVATWIRSLGYYVENELQSSAVASCFSAVITTLAGEADGGLPTISGQDSADQHSSTFDHFEPGLVGRLMPGEDMKVFDPSRGHAEASVFVELMIRSMAVATGLSYERLSRDYSKTNYSSNRASDLEDRREFRPEQEWIAADLCRPVYERFIASAVAAGLDGYPSPSEFVIDPDRTTEHIWQAPGWEWVDPLKEQKSSAQAIAANLSTLEIEAGKRGLDWKDLLQQRAREQEMANAILPQPQPQPVDDIPEDDNATDDEMESLNQPVEIGDDSNG